MSNFKMCKFRRCQVDLNGKIDFEPQKLVFREKQSLLVGPDGKPVMNW